MGVTRVHWGLSTKISINDEIIDRVNKADISQKIETSEKNFNWSLEWFWFACQRPKIFEIYWPKLKNVLNRVIFQNLNFQNFFKNFIINQFGQKPYRYRDDEIPRKDVQMQ